MQHQQIPETCQYNDFYKNELFLTTIIGGPFPSSLNEHSPRPPHADPFLCVFADAVLLAWNDSLLPWSTGKHLLFFKSDSSGTWSWSLPCLPWVMKTIPVLQGSVDTPLPSSSSPSFPSRSLYYLGFVFFLAIFISQPLRASFLWEKEWSHPFPKCLTLFIES